MFKIYRSTVVVLVVSLHLQKGVLPRVAGRVVARGATECASRDCE